MYQFQVNELGLKRSSILTNGSPLARLIPVSLPLVSLVFPVSAGLTTDRRWIAVSGWKNLLENPTFGADQKRQPDLPLSHMLLAQFPRMPADCKQALFSSGAV